jgi:hypothetical protein
MRVDCLIARGKASVLQNAKSTASLPLIQVESPRQLAARHRYNAAPGLVYANQVGHALPDEQSCADVVYQLLDAVGDKGLSLPSGVCA